MGRAKIAMEFISKEKARNTTYLKRKRGLIKKGHEFSILCNVPVCIIIYPYKEGKPSLEPEVYTFHREGNSSRLDLARATNPEMAKEIIDRYVAFPKEEKAKRTLNLYDMFDEWQRRADQELFKVRHKNALAKYPKWNSTIGGFNADQLMELLVQLDQKLEFVRQRAAMIKGNQAALVPYIEHEPINNNVYLVDHHHHQMGCIDVEYFNQFPLFNYPIQESQHMVSFDPNGFPNQMAPVAPDHHIHGGGSSSNLFMYNMNMMGRGPLCYDQGSGTADSDAVGSSYGAGLPVSMPLQLPMLPNVTLPSHCQMFYK